MIAPALALLIAVAATLMPPSGGARARGLPTPGAKAACCCCPLPPGPVPPPPTSLAYARHFTVPVGTLVSGDPATLTPGPAGGVYASGYGWLGRFTGSAAVADARTGQLRGRPPGIDGQVSAAIGDGRGGWYVGGDFDVAGGVARSYLARLSPDGAIDSGFRPHVDGFVDAIARSGSRLYIAGFFERVDGRARPGLAELDARTGRLVSAFAPGGIRNATEMVLTSTAVYAGATPAEDRSVGSRYEADPVELIAFSRQTGAALRGFTPNRGDPITALAADGDRVFVGRTSNATTGTGSLSSLDARTGTADPGFRGPADAVQVLLMDRRRLLAGLIDRGAVALNPASGRADPGFRCHGANTVNAITEAGGALWLAGSRPQAYGQYRVPLAPAGIVQAVSARSCVPRAAQRLTPTGAVNAIARSGARLLIGGSFAAASADRASLAALSTTGSWEPGFRPPRLTPLADASAPGRLWVLTPHRLVALDPGSGRLVAIFPHARLPIDPFDDITNAPVRFLVAGPRVIAGFAQPDGHLHVVAWSTTTGRAVPFRPPLPGYTLDLEAANGALYLAGSYRRTRPSGQRANLAVLRVDPDSLRLDPAFDPHVNGPVSSVVASAHTLYLTGLFGLAGPRELGAPPPVRRPGFAAIDGNSGTVDRAFAPVPPPVPPDSVSTGSNATMVAEPARVLRLEDIAYDFPVLVHHHLEGCTLERVSAYSRSTGAREPSGVPGGALMENAVTVGRRLLAPVCVPVFQTISDFAPVWSLRLLG